jgi:hypothetical protein
VDNFVDTLHLPATEPNKINGLAYMYGKIAFGQIVMNQQLMIAIGFVAELARPIRGNAALCA